MTPGWKTSEFWHTIAAQGLAFLTMLGVITNNDSKTLDSSIGNCITAVFALLMNGLVVVGYIRSRFMLKHTSITTAISKEVTKCVLIGTAALLCFHGTPAMAQSALPWRNNIAQKIAQHDAALLALQNRQQTPTPAPQIIQAPAPQIIMVPQPSAPIQQQSPAHPPLQTFPIQGQPQQVFPIQGAPLQQFPIQGQPQQSFPIQGQPQQSFPIQGQPQQVFPMAPPTPAQPPANPSPINGPIAGQGAPPPITPLPQQVPAPIAAPTPAPSSPQVLPIAPPATPQPLPIAPMPPASTGPQTYSINRALANPIP